MNIKRSSIWVFIIAIILFNLACGLPSILKDKGEAEPEAAAAVPSIPLGDEYRSEEGGFRFNRIPDYALEEFFGLVSMLAPDADSEAGPGMILVGGMNEDPKTSEQILEDFVSNLQPGEEIYNQRDVTIDGYPGIAVDVNREVNGLPVFTRVIVMALTPTRVFNVMGFAPQDKWQVEFEPLFEAVLATVHFFEPTTEEGTSGGLIAEETGNADEPLEAAASAETIRQWAITATASSEYSSPDWAAHQATGAPDTFECGDLITAWASYDGQSIEWLELGYAAPVFPTEVNIYETHSPTQIVKVELLDTSGSYHQVFTASPQIVICPSILSVQVTDASYQAVGVRITVDQTQLEAPWNEIDAVELVGYAAVPLAETTTEQVVAPPPTVVVGGADLSAWKWTSYSKTDGLPDDNTRSIAVAPDGTVWVGTFGAGVARLKNGSFTSYTTADGLGHNQVMAMAVASDGAVWAGTITGLSRFNGSSWTNYKRADGLAYDSVYALAASSDGSLWVGTGGGVSLYKNNAFTSYTKNDGLADNYVNDIAIDKDGGVWFATMKGVSYFYNGAWKNYTENDGLVLNMVNTVAVAPDGAVWFGTSSGGTSRFDGNTWTTYADAASISARYVTAIRNDTDGALWFATQGDGVFRFDRSSWLHFSKKGGEALPGDSLEDAAVAPDGAVWFATQNRGIVRFGP